MNHGVSIPVLTYHQVVDDATLPDNFWARDYTYISQFAAQLEFLANAGFNPVTHDEVYQWITSCGRLPPKPIMLTFDDARLSVLENVYPRLRRRGWRATVYVITALADGRSAPGHPLAVPSMNWEQLRVLRDAGWTIGSHTRTHVPVRTPHEGLRQRLLSELAGSKTDIERALGVGCTCFAYPGGTWNRHGERLVQTLYASARHWQWRGRVPPCNQRTDPYRLPSMNISFHWSLEDFNRLVSGPHPLFGFQRQLDWNGHARGARFPSLLDFTRIHVRRLALHAFCRL